MKLKIGR
jgi:hypothetical protein